MGISRPHAKLYGLQCVTPTTFHESRRGVPYLLTNDRKCSVCYFGSTDTYRIWEGFNSESCRVVGTYPDENFVIDYLNDFHPQRR